MRICLWAFIRAWKPRKYGDNMLYLYTGINPNTARGTYYYFTNVQNYISNALPAALLSIGENDYRYTGGQIRVALQNVSDIKTVTYARISNSAGEWFYHVTGVEYVSGHAVISVMADLWATYLADADISEIMATRCNRAIGGGVYDDIELTVSRTVTKLTEDVPALSIVAVVAVATGTSSILVNNSATYLGLYEFEFSKLSPPEGVSIFDYAVALVAGVYSADATIGDLPAAVLKAYIVPHSVLGVRAGAAIPSFNSKSIYGDIALTPEAEVAPFSFHVNFTLNIDPDYEYIAGTALDGIRVPRTVEPQTVTYTYTAKQDGITVTVRIGDEVRDITNQFSVGLTSNDGNYTTQERIAGTLGIIGNIASGAFQIAAGGSGVVTGALAIGSSLNNIAKPGKPSFSAGGDGLNTFRLLAGTAGTPYRVQSFKSARDESARARLYGAKVSTPLESIEDAFTPDLIGTGTFTETFLACDCKVQGVPNDAQETIAQALSDGVHILSV